MPDTQRILDAFRRGPITVAGDLHIHVHEGEPPDLGELKTFFLSENSKLLEAFKMALSQETKDLIKAFDDATNDLATKIDALENADENEIRAALGPIKDRLRAMGSNPTEPIPPAEETPTA